MEHVVPVLGIDGYDEAVEFYCTGLGFTLLFEHRHEPGFPVFMAVQRGNLFIALSEHARGHQGSEVYVYIDDVAEWHRRCEAAGIVPEHGPQKMPWGNTEMVLKDPFRNTLRITQENTHPGENTPNKGPA